MDPQTTWLIISLCFGERGNVPMTPEGAEEIQAMVCVINNRLGDPRWGETAEDVLWDATQFHCLLGDQFWKAYERRCNPHEEIRLDFISRTVNSVLYLPDITGGADSFCHGSKAAKRFSPRHYQFLGRYGQTYTFRRRR